VGSWNCDLGEVFYYMLLISVYFFSILIFSLILDVEGNHDSCVCFVIVPGFSNLHSDFVYFTA